jgi:hypothetical protein
MRFMGLVKTNEDQGEVPQALTEAMGKFIEKTMKAGQVMDTGGLAPSAASRRVRLSGGRVAVVDGPYSETKEIVGGYAIFDVSSLDEAIRITRDFLELHVTYWPGWEGECELRQIFGPED